MKTFTNKEIPENIRGLLYLCKYTAEPPSIEVIGEKQYLRPADALDAYANTPNPESQLAMGDTKEGFEREVERLHKNMQDPKWLKDLNDYL